MQELKIKNDINSEVSYFNIESSVFSYLNDNLKSNNYSVVVYLDNEVKIGSFIKNNDTFTYSFHKDNELNEQFIQKIRVFNKDEEVLIWRTNKLFKGRHRKDISGSNTEYLDVKQVLFGTQENHIDDFTLLSENKRGISLVVPGKFKTSESKHRVAIKTRNYIDYNEIHQASYIDCRFLEFVQLGD